MATERKEKLIRVLQILETTDYKTPMNATQIVEKLRCEYDIENVDRRSIYRDIKLLQDCGYTITQTKDKRSGWYMDKHAFDDWEIKIMMDSIQQARCISVNEAKEIKEKLLKLTSKRGRSRFSHIIMPPLGNADVDSKIGEYIELMLEAMYLHKKIKFQYTFINEKMQKELRKEGRFYNLNLYSIYWSDNNYYMIGSHDNYEGLSNYRLDRVENLQISDENATEACEKIGDNPELVIQDYIQNSVYHFLGKTIRIEVEFKPEPATNAILYDFAGDDIIVKNISKDRCRATFTKMDSVTLTRWFAQYGDMFKVIKPKSLKNSVIENLKKMLEVYEG